MGEVNWVWKLPLDVSEDKNNGIMKYMYDGNKNISLF